MDIDIYKEKERQLTIGVPLEAIGRKGRENYLGMGDFLKVQKMKGMIFFFLKFFFKIFYFIF